MAFTSKFSKLFKHVHGLTDLTSNIRIMVSSTWWTMGLNAAFLFRGPLLTLLFLLTPKSHIPQWAAATQHKKQREISPRKSIQPFSLPKDICNSQSNTKLLPISLFQNSTNGTPPYWRRTSLQSWSARYSVNPAKIRYVLNMQWRPQWVQDSLQQCCQGPVSLHFILMCKHCNLQPG